MLPNFCLDYNVLSAFAHRREFRSRKRVNYKTNPRGEMPEGVTSNRKDGGHALGQCGEPCRRLLRRRFPKRLSFFF